MNRSCPTNLAKNAHSTSSMLGATVLRRNGRINGTGGRLVLFVVVALVVTSVLAGPTFAVGSTRDANQAATSTDGVVAQGRIDRFAGGYQLAGSILPDEVPREIDDTLHPVLEQVGFTWDDAFYPRAEVLAPDGQPIAFYALFVHPKGIVTGTGRLEADSRLYPYDIGADVDMRQPWGVLEVSRPGTDLSGCSTGPRNVTNFDDTTEGTVAGTLDDVWFEISCDVGLGYDHWQVHFYQDPDVAYLDTPAYRYPWHWFGHGYEVNGLTRPTVYGDMAVCGHLPDGGWDCYTAATSSSGWASIYPSVAAMTAGPPTS